MHPSYSSDDLEMLSGVSVSELARYLKELLEVNDVLQNIWVWGEVSNCKVYASGHCYFTLKDGDAQIPCVFFKNARLRSSAPLLQDGNAAAVNGRVAFYERDGKLQIYVESVRLIGTEGELFKRFEQLKERLAAEGLFDGERKRELPSQPAVIGIVTSPQAAALRDMLRVLRMRYPLVRVILAPTLVQGAEAPAAIAAAIDLLNEHAEADVLIVGRGGGSIEELWAFNEEVVARAIARSRIPVISGIGHETDFTIADFVADYRASTPTAAASAAVPSIEEWQSEIQEKQDLLQSLMEEHLFERQEQLKSTLRDLARSSPMNLVDRRRQQLDEATERLQVRMQHLLSLDGERLRGTVRQLHSLSPLLTIARGYAVVRRDTDQALITGVQQVHTGEKLTIQVQDGLIPVEVRQ
ncbi:exodeoxyribonuclease VII large subunit [Ktedonosporobacter rubrisoli]|uniref:Exodeoxyribonuclease 7 large subunit n=1 Tax=Ktedonosporobacter rubrisoli TaxID=2509675 RepID=A0A4P6JSL4_KTERU|nr:exodeoxyribonuclease VII large subunit [Ktedonosporobacter rubrisoli]QBD78404.1 exodeoxyribonuclease VII large subunit [Ktedonosporobacter rubrisoli]